MERFDQPDLSIEQMLSVIQHGVIEEVHGLLPWGSNYTVLVTLTTDQYKALAVYKPRRGERPLWDFPDGTLCNREVAAFEISNALGWNIVPPTLLREGPQGIGSIQYFIPHDPEQHYFTFDGQYQTYTRRIALFDIIINNADRKAGHCIVDKNKVVWGIDHGICFHPYPKLRTVIWEYANTAIFPEHVQSLATLCTRLETTQLKRRLEELLTSEETKALKQRLEGLLESGIYPEAGQGRSYPWPPV